MIPIRPFVHASVLSVLIFSFGSWLLGKPAPGLTQFKQKPPVAWIVCEVRQAQTFGRPLLIFLGCRHVTLSIFQLCQLHHRQMSRLLSFEDGGRPFQTTFSRARGLSLIWQGNRPCRLCGRSAGPNGCGRRDQTFPHSWRSGSPTWS
jgi:hypothetical protein